MNNQPYFNGSMRYWILLIVGIFSITLSFASNPIVPADPCDKDKTPPVLTNCPKDMDLYVDCGLNCTRLDWWMNPTVTDNCDPNPKLWYEVNGKVIDIWYCFPLGITTVSVYAQDKAGNKSFCSYNINTKTKEDYMPPTITCPKDIMVSIRLYNICRTVEFETPKVTDNCDPSPKIVCTILDGQKDVVIDKNYCFPVGKTRVTCTATDKTGNKSSCGFWINVMLNGDLVRAVDENITAIANKDNKIGEKTASASEDGFANFTLQHSTSQNLLRKEFTIYPNPTGDFVNLELQQYSGKNVAVQIFNTVGQQVFITTFKEVADQVYRVEMQTYPTGMYFIKVTSEGVETIAKKVMKQ